MENKEIHQPFDKLDELSLPTGDVIPKSLNQLLSLYKQRLKTIELTRWYYSLPPRCTRSRCWPKVSKWGFHANSSKKNTPSAFAWSAVVLDVRWVLCQNFFKGIALTQHPLSVAATHHDLKAYGCHVKGGPVRSTKALLHLLLPLVTAPVVPETVVR